MSKANELIAELVEKWTPTGDFVAAVQGAKLADHLRQSDPDLLTEWLDHNAAYFLSDQFRQHSRASRAKTLRSAKVRAFRTATDAADDGDMAPLSHFNVRYVIDTEGTQRRVADMVGADHLYVSFEYRASANYEAMLAAFHAAVAKKVGKKRTADVLSEEDYERLFLSIVKRSA